MDLTNTTTTKSPDTENETPPLSQPIKSLSFTNGVIKKHHHLHPPHVAVTYSQCLKNHAASLGGHALDGCGEFMPSPTASSTDPASLKCAACGCHRNFHRRESDDSTSLTTQFLEFHGHHPPPPRGTSPSASPPPLKPSNYSYAPHMLLALRAAVPEDPTMNHHPPPQETATAFKAENSSGRKRFRTKFNQEQKEKMFSFAEKLGWKMQKCEEEMVGEFCNEIGIGKGVLKVWMHNNKSTLGKRDTTTTTATAGGDGGGSNGNMSNGRVSYENNGHNSNSYHENEIHVSTNGSSSSS